MTGVKAGLARALCHPWIGHTIRWVFRGRVPSLRFPGWRVETDVPVRAAETAASIFWGIYESAELRFVGRHLRTDLDVVELGSSIGVVSSAIAGRLGPDRTLVCVEANPELIGLLERNVRANSRGCRVVVRNRAIDYENESAVVSVADAHTGGRTVGASSDGVRSHQVPAATLSGLLRDEGIGDYALVSDIEGAEAAILDRDAEALARCRQLVIELHRVERAGRVLTVEDLAASLTGRHGFTVRARHGPCLVLERP